MTRSAIWLAALTLGCSRADTPDAATIQAGVVAQGGHWAQDTLAPGTIMPVVIHRIPKYCYSPGVGLIVARAAVPMDSLWGLTEQLLPRLAREAEPTDEYLTVTYLTTGDTAKVYKLGFHRSIKSGQWRFMAYSVPEGVHGQQLNEIFRRQREAT